MDIGCVEVSVWILVVSRLVYVYWLYEDKCMDIGCVWVSLRIMVVWRLVYGYWLSGRKCMDIGCVWGYYYEYMLCEG